MSLVSPSLELIIEPKNPVDFITFSADGTITIEIENSQIGTFEIVAILKDN